MTELVLPSLDRYDAWKACMEDFGDAHDEVHGSGHWFLPEPLQFETDRLSFEALVAILTRFRDELPGERFVPSDTFWIFDGEEMVGFLQLRKRLTQHLLDYGGHIGYSIRPSRRREGHAGRALGLALGRCRELGIERVLVACDEGNVASAATIERAGGAYEDTRVMEPKGERLRRYWIEPA